MSELQNKKHERFCREYIIDHNGGAAARRSGYSTKTADQQACRLLRNVKIDTRIKELEKEKAADLGITAERVLAEYVLLAFSDIQNYIEIVEDTGAIKPKAFKDMPEGASRAIESIKEDRVIKEDSDGKKCTVYDKINFKLYSKISALDKLGEYLGLWDKGNQPTLIQKIFSLKEFFEDYDKFNNGASGASNKSSGK